METPLSLDPPQPWPGPKPPAGRPHVWQGKEFGFGDLVDVVNPLQHIPVVNTIYRAVTGDEIGNVPRVVGDTLFGGPLGFITGMINVALREESGKDLGEHALAMLTPDEAGDPASSAIAAQPAKDGGEIAAAGGKEEAADAAPADATVTSESGPAALPAVADGTTQPPHPDLRPHATAVAARSDSGITDSKQAFLAQSAASQRRLLGSMAMPGAGGGATATARPLNSRPVPLQLPPIPGFTLGRPMRPGMVAAVAAAATAPATAVPSALPAPEAGATAAAALPSNPPIDISQRMLDALDKYARMQQERSAEAGNRVDVSQ